MDTISRENNSMLPVAGVIVGALALILGLYSAVSISKVRTKVDSQQEKVDKIDDLTAQVSAASTKADGARTYAEQLAKQTQTGFDTVGTALGTVQAQVAKIEEASKRPVVGGKGHHEAAVAGPGEYIVKPHDTSSKIARANGVSRADLLAVNPGVNWSKLKVGEKLKLPEKKS